jgi:hypothetical protein
MPAKAGTHALRPTVPLLPESPRSTLMQNEQPTAAFFKKNPNVACLERPGKLSKTEHDRQNF